MSIDLVFFIISYFTIIFSILGYGSFFSKFANQDNIECLGYKGLIGIFILILYSYISHLFYKHSLVHNSIIIILGLVFFLHKKAKISFTDIRNVFLIFSIILVGFFIFKTHDDFPYYHFPYTYHLTQNFLTTGIGQINHGFRTPSSIFYLNSLSYLPFIKYYMFHIGTLAILGFSNLILLNYVFIYLKKKKFDFLFFFILLIFCFINIFFYRLQEHGTDRSAQILIFILFINLFLLRDIKTDISKTFTLLIILFSLIVSLKSFYFLYLVLLPVMLYYLILDNKFHELKIVFKNPFFYLSLILTVMVLLSYFFNTGCFIYPVSFTCVESLDWSLKVIDVKQMNNWYEQWSKAGATPNFRVENPEVYIQKFNWVGNWMQLYFFNKVSDYLLGLFFMSIVFLILFKGNLRKNRKSFKFLYYYLAIILLFIEWFYNHPALRYGGYVLMALILFLPLSNFLSNLVNLNKIKIKVYGLILLVFLIFFSRNVDRILNEVDLYNYKPLKNPYYNIDENHFRMEKKLKLYLDTNK